MQVMNNIYQVLGGAYANIANIFVIKGNDSLIMIDSAETPEELDMIDENIKYWGLSDYPISHVLVSHKHFNHIGNLHTLKKRGAIIVAGAGDAKAIETGEINEICDFGPFPKKPDYIPCPVDIKAEDGDIINASGLCFEVISTPGHTNGSVFYKLVIEDKIVMFTGDVIHVGPDCSSAILGWEGGVDYNRSVYFESIKKFSQLKCDILLSGHYQLCMQNGWKILQDAYGKALTQWRLPAIVHE